MRNICPGPLFIVFAVLLLCPIDTPAREAPAAEKPEYVVLNDPVIALTEVRIIDGTGSSSVGNQSIIISNGMIKAVGPSASVKIPSEAKQLNMAGRTILPGLIMLHEHMMYFSGRAIWHAQPISYPPLYLAAGVTTLRTGGTEHPTYDVNLKKRIDAGHTAGPRMFLTGPFFNGPQSGDLGGFLGDTVLLNAEEARQAVRFWASRGFTSFKVYDAITPETLAAVIDAAHDLKLTVTGHLGSVSCRQAVQLGIDFIEHSFASCKKDLGFKTGEPFKAALNKPEVESLIRYLADSGVVLVSTPFSRRPLSDEELEMMHPQIRENYLRSIRNPPPWWPDPEAEKEVRKLERRFAELGGRLAIGADAADFGQIAGYANHRALELFVESGWSPLEVIRLATSNAANILGVDKTVGVIVEGHAADLLVVPGDPSRKIEDLRKIELVFKNGVAYDPKKLRVSVKGLVGWH